MNICSPRQKSVAILAIVDKFRFMPSKIHYLKNKSKIRLDEFLRGELPKIINSQISNSKIRRLIVAGSVSVDSRQVRIPAFVLFPSSSVAVSLDSEKLFFEKQPDDIDFELSEKDVLFEDDSIIVVNKPSFFPTEAGMVKSRDNLHAAVVRYLFERQKIEFPNMKNPPYVGIMHRLDRETSGVILFTKKRSVNTKCHEMFEFHSARKTYRAVVTDEKCPFDVSAFPKKFSVEFSMGRISPKSQAAKWGRVQSGGQDSKTDFSILNRKKVGGFDVLCVECCPLTGRTHQIRVHLSSVGLPIIGDELYGGADFRRIMLHASSLTFPHPVTGETMTVEAPLPEGF